MIGGKSPDPQIFVETVFGLFVCLERGPPTVVRPTHGGKGRGPLYRVPVSQPLEQGRHPSHSVLRQRGIPALLQVPEPRVSGNGVPPSPGPYLSKWVLPFGSQIQSRFQKAQKAQIEAELCGSDMGSFFLFCIDEVSGFSQSYYNDNLSKQLLSFGS